MAMKSSLLLLILLVFGDLSHARASGGDCDQRIRAAFDEARGGGFLIPEKYFSPQAGDCGGYFGRACGQFIVPYVVMHKVFRTSSELEAATVNKMLGTGFAPGNYYLMYVNTGAGTLHLRCPTRAELQARDSEGECATRSDCGCNPAFIDGEGRTSGDIVEGFVDGLNRSGGYCSAVKMVTLK